MLILSIKCALRLRHAFLLKYYYKVVDINMSILVGGEYM